eukprot:TRINITY_DN21258_c0_g1_i1.p1 TRINITY_DN21258_c0_g1~~TRINITY_DN21258_c0_g1_i1.p1  ORF type:complete len:185 (-),score=50.76 TRINITY_DN21258_c0_g1_i1:191-745(-)
MPTPTEKFHSAIRWGKPVAEAEQVMDEEKVDVECQDEKNGNRPIHIASQNGHLELVTWLVAKGCDVNAQNGTGATALHMSVAYDSVPCTRVLLEAGAKTDLKNEAGHEAITGLEGDHTGANSWDAGINILQAANTLEMALEGLKKLEENHEGVDKAKLAMLGMKKKKEIKDWPVDRFKELIMKL